MIAPPLNWPGFEAEPKVIRSTPMKITAKAMKNSHVANGKREVLELASGEIGLSLAWHSEQRKWIGSMQLLQPTRPQPWQT
jgi:hypothetical protein